MVLGGTIGQLLVPAAFMVYFYMRKEFFSSAVTLFWTSQNFFGISLYVKDAQAMALPLVSVGGGEGTIYDWNYLLTKLGLLRWDHAVGNMIYVLGIVIIIISILWGFHNSIEQRSIRRYLRVLAAPVNKNRTARSGLSSFLHLLRSQIYPTYPVYLAVCRNTQ